MKKAIHPKLHKITLTCSTCGTAYQLESAKSTMSIDTCSHCHPFYTGQNTFKRATGRVEKFNRKYINKN